MVAAGPGSQIERYPWRAEGSQSEPHAPIDGCIHGAELRIRRSSMATDALAHRPFQIWPVRAPAKATSLGLHDDAVHPAHAPRALWEHDAPGPCTPLLERVSVRSAKGASSATT
jgi:hypothetical protein